METVLNCTSGTLDPYAPSAAWPWDRQRAAHLYRRLGFGAPFQVLEQALTQNPVSLADSLVDAALNAPLSPPPAWANWTYNDYDNFTEQLEEQFVEWLRTWVTDMLDNPLRGKLTLFWHNHFVTEFDTYVCPSYLYRYHKVLQQHCLGNFKEFVYEMGKTPAMLVYLNGLLNSKNAPNENYARELYELFTLGADNGYTQQDIVETARALTGYTLITAACGDIYFNPFDWDNGPKTIFGQTGNWGYGDVVDILFEQRGEEIADFICSKIYRYFVHPEVDENIVSGLAETFINNNFELEPVFRQLFRSEHFFDEAVLGVQVKSPLELTLGFLNESDVPIGPEMKELAIYTSGQLGQTLSIPVNVAGWPGNRTWISNSTLTGRWNTIAYLMYLNFQQDAEQFRTLAQTLAGDPNSNMPELVAGAIIEQFVPVGLQTPDLYERAYIVFKADIPENYYATGQWNLNWETVPYQVTLLLNYLNRLPEFQLA